MKIVVLDASTLGDVSNLKDVEKFGDVTYFDATNPKQTVERSENADIILTNKVIIDKAVIDKLPKLKLVCITATGMNNVDLEYAKQKGIEVKNAVGYSTHSVSQVTFSMAFHLLSNLNEYDKYVKSKEYSLSSIFTNLLSGFSEMRGKKWGIIGMGNIGRNVAKIASSFGAEVIYHSTSGVKRDEGYEQVSLKELLNNSDIISLHSPLNDTTANLIDADELSMMKKSAILINVARGGIVNENALVDALNNNIIAGAGVDVFTKEPIEKDSPFYKINNKEKIVLSPHIAWASAEARQTLMEKVIENIEEFINKK